MSKCEMCRAGMPSSCLTGSCESMDTTQFELEPEKTLSKPLEPTTPVIHSRTVLGIEITNENYDEVQDERNMSESRNSLDESRGSGDRVNSKRGSSDSQSAGRKHAAKQYPLDGEAPCEWLGKANCGGGDYPILGCLEGKQQARHHGPEKNVQNNEPGNVHRICHYCHYRWHAKNDPTYDWNAGIWAPHLPRSMDSKEKTKQAIDYMRYLTTGRRGKQLQELD